MSRLYIAGLSEANGTADPPETHWRVPGWLFYLLTAALSLWMFVYVAGLWPWLGWAEGSAKHGTSGARIAESTALGLPAMYLAEGQTAVWDYQVRVTGDAEILLKVGKVVPQPDFIVKVQRIRASGTGRFIVTAPTSGFYSFDHELAPVGGGFGRVAPGSIYYRLYWGVE